MDKPTLAFTCGGTGGHVTPAIALAQELSEFNCQFIGSGSREDHRIIIKYTFPFTAYTINHPYLRHAITHISTCKNWLQTTQAKALICTGGSQTLYPAIAAKLLGIPLFVLEQNTIPGRTNRLLAKLATAIYTNYEQSLSFFPKHKTTVTGNPIRKQFLNDEVSKAIKSIILPTKQVILIVGGSQGSLTLNKLIHNHYDYFQTSNYSLIHLTGHHYYATHFTQQPINHDRHIITAPYCENMALLCQLSSLVIGRSGASTLSELSAFHKPAILIPFPHAKDNHQLTNARQFCSQYPGVIINEHDLSFNKLITQIDYLNHALFPTTTTTDHARESIANAIRKHLLP